MISLILMASGYSRRFGSNKLLYSHHGKPMYLYSLDLMKKICEAEICGQKVSGIVVTQYTEIAESSLRYGMKCIHNLQAEEGIAVSVRLGTSASDCADWYVFLTADQPGLQADTVRRFLTCALESGKSMASVFSVKQPGNPTLFSSLWREELLKLTGDKGGRKIMMKHPEEVYWFKISQDEIRDIDVKPL